MSDPYASHLPVLSRVLRSLPPSPLHILEIGCGLYSTPLLSAFAHGCCGVFRCIESNPAWAGKMRGMLDIPIEDHSPFKLPESVRQPWDVVFIDSEPADSRRGYAVEMQPYAGTILLHDSNPDWDAAFGYSSIRSRWAYSHNFDMSYPNTLLLSAHS